MDEKVWEFKSIGKFNIAGRGTVFTTRLEQEIPFKEVYGQLIEVDGKLYLCRGIERFAKFRGPDAPLEPGEAVGLLVGPAKEK
jgi:hypothetical protein